MNEDIKNYLAFARGMSRCARRKVGAVVADGSGTLVMGYNKMGEPFCDEGGCPRGRRSYDETPTFSDYSDCVAVHAEVDAVEQFHYVYGVAARGSRYTVYTSCAPCPDCERFLRERELKWQVVELDD